EFDVVRDLEEEVRTGETRKRGQRAGKSSTSHSQEDLPLRGRTERAESSCQREIHIFAYDPTNSSAHRWRQEDDYRTGVSASHSQFQHELVHICLHHGVSLSLNAPPVLLASLIDYDFIYSSAHNHTLISSLTTRTAIVPPLPTTVPALLASLLSTQSSSQTHTLASSSHTSSSHLSLATNPSGSTTTSSFPPSTLSSLYISSILQTMPTSALLRNCALNHERLQQGLPVVNLVSPLTSTPTIPISTSGVNTVEPSLLSQLATLISSQSQS
ncbi:hypothetical protein PMAYCL1PPCAC_03937, partial [Pristionchus mayeri]